MSTAGSVAISAKAKKLLESAKHGETCCETTLQDQRQKTTAKEGG
jgi:hypothetical protein